MHQLLVKKSIHHLIFVGNDKESAIALIRPWILAFLSSGEAFGILTENQKIQEALMKSYPNLQVFYAKTELEIYQVLSSFTSLRAIYYVFNSPRNMLYVRYNEYEHISLGHGDSEKWSNTTKVFRLYDQVWVSGQAHVDRFQNAGFRCSDMKLVKIGQPLLKKVIQHSLQATSEQIILYLPTCEAPVEAINYCSLSFSSEMISKVSELLQLPVSVKLHPGTGQKSLVHENLEKDLYLKLQQSDFDHSIIDKHELMEEAISEANVFICDISSSATACLASGGPIFLYVPSSQNLKLSSSKMPFHDYCYTFSDTEELLLKIKTVLIEGTDTLKENRKRALQYFIGVEETLNDEFIKQLKSVRMASLD